VPQWVLSLPIPLRLLLTRYPNELSKVMGIIHRAAEAALKAVNILVEWQLYSIQQQLKIGAGILFFSVIA
jgi:hypothetical protein